MFVVFLIIISSFWPSLHSAAAPDNKQEELEDWELIKLSSLISSVHPNNALVNSRSIDELYDLLKKTSQYSDSPTVAKFQTLIIQKYHAIASDPEETEKILSALIENREIQATILYCHAMRGIASQSVIVGILNSPVNPKNWIDLSISYFTELFERKIEGEKTGLNPQELRYILSLIERLNVNSPVFNSQIPIRVRDWLLDLKLLLE